MEEERDIASPSEVSQSETSQWQGKTDKRGCAEPESWNVSEDRGPEPCKEHTHNLFSDAGADSPEYDW